MPTNAREIYLQFVRTLPLTEKLHLAHLIFNDLSQEKVSVVEPRDTSTEEDCLDATTRSIQSEAVLAGVNTYQALENIQQQLRQEICDRPQAETNLKQTLATLQQIQVQLIQNEKMSALGKLLAGVVHEIKNPLGVLAGNINDIKQEVRDAIEHLSLYQQHYPNPAAPIQQNAEDIDLEFLIEDLPKSLNLMQIAIDRINNISTSLRYFTRADLYFKVFCNIHDNINSTLLILKYRLKTQQNRPEIKIIKNYGDIPKVECFSGQLSYVFMTILVNAIDMFDKMSQTRSSAEIQANPPQISIRTEILSDRVKISIRDNGLGMSEDVKAKIFDFLFICERSRKPAGFGLPSARQIVVEKHGGAIEVDSTLGQGTEFIIILPVGGS